VAKTQRGHSKLYEWNVEAGQALVHDIAHFGVTLGNADDAAVSATWPYGHVALRKALAPSPRVTCRDAQLPEPKIEA
jgi:hypothetical protein